MTGPDTKGGALTAALGLCGVAAAALFLVADVVGIVRTPDYSVVSQAISELVERGAPAKAAVDPPLAAYHALVPIFAIGLHRGLPGRRGGALGPALIGGAGLAGVVLTLFFPCDPGCEPFVSLPGTLHIFIAIPMGFAILGGIWATGRRLARVPGWTRHARYAKATALAGLLLAVTTVALAETGIVGLWERLLTWSYLQWYAVMGALVAWRAAAARDGPT